jgi:hypothetical protein
VRGLTDALDEYFPKFALPVRLNSVVLLLFLDKVIADGFFKPYPVIFGGNIKFELKEIYAEAKRKNKIVSSL